MFIKPVGRVPNAASRIEGLNKRLGTTVLASAVVTAGLDDELLLRSCGRFVLPGMDEVVTVTEIIAPMAEATAAERLLVAAFADALTLFNERRWEDARLLLERVLEQNPDDGPTLFYRDLCAKWHTLLPTASDPTVIVLHNK